MQRFLIPLFVCLLIGIPTFLDAQVPQEISLPAGPFNYPATPHTPASPDFLCNSAGTYNFVQFIGHSNDTDLPKIYLCANDSFLLRHNNDAVLSGDPDPSTPAGIAYALYTCQPTVTGDNLQAIGAIPGPGDACVLNVPATTNGLYITPGVANGGDSWFFNSGSIISTFGSGQPISIFYAPITVDEITPPSGFESAFVGAPPGPCVNVNTSAAFEVVYLNPITISTNSTPPNDCIGLFTVRGGFPEQDNSGVYTINIALTSNPSIKAIIHTQQSQLHHLAPVLFSVPQSGNYTITIEDGKGCPGVFNMDLNACDATDNIVMTIPETIAPPGTTNVCVPVTVQNFNIISGSFSMAWDPTIIQYQGVSNVNPAVDVSSGFTVFDGNAGAGLVGMTLYDQTGNVISIADNDTLFEICFNVVGQLGQCSGLTVLNNPTAVGFEDGMGQAVALTVDTGSVCVQFLPLGSNIEIIDTTCLGTATMVVTALGGVSPYDVIVQEIGGPTYSGSIVGTGNTFTVNNVGNFNNVTSSYSVCITDHDNTTVCDTIDVYIPTLGAQIDFTQQPKCNGDDNGILGSVVLVGGVPVTDPGSNYTYQWTPSTLPDPTGPVQDGTINGGVPSGNYTLVITDTNRHCSSNPASGFLGQPLPISEDVITLTPASCSGVSNGAINYTVEGGTPFTGNQYQFAWEDANHNPVGTPGQNNPIIVNGLSSGTYSVTITDANGCTKTDNVTINDQKTVSLNQGTIQSVSCFGLSDGGATVTITENPPSGSPYTFTWTPGGFTQNNVNLASAYGNLPAGNYFVSAQDAAGCKDTLTVMVPQPAKLVADTLGLQGPGCGQANTGTINVTANGGTGGPNYTYTWDIPATGALQSGLGVGTYNVTVTDTHGCADSLSFELLPPTPPSFTLDSTEVKCGSDGSLFVNAPTAATIKWTSLPGNTTIGSTDTISNLQGGTYAVEIQDALGCISKDTVMLSSVTPMSFADTTFLQPSCFGDDNGTLGVTVQDGKPPYVNFKWGPGTTFPNSSTIFALTAGNYVLTVTDNVGCTLTGSFTLSQPPAIVNTLSGINGVSCFGICDGTASVTTQYATTPPTAGTFTYIWNDGVSTSAMRTDLCAGQYIVTGVDANNCSDSDTLTIGTPTQVTGTATTIPTACFGADNGSAQVVPSGGNGSPYSFNWSSGATTSNANNLEAGPYTVTITDTDGCTGVVTGISVTEPAEIVVSVQQSNNPSCFGSDDGAIVVNVSGGNVGNLSYEWSDDMGVIASSKDSLNNLPAGFYSVVVTDAQGCTGSLSDISLVDPAPVLGSYQTPEPLLCNGDETILNIDTIQGGSGGPYQFNLDDGALLDPGFPVSLNGGIHTITYYDYNGCFYTDTLTVNEPAPIEVTFNVAVEEIELGDTLHQLKPIITGATVNSFEWSPMEYLHYPLLNQDSIEPSVRTFESRTYTLVVYDEKGCSGTGSITINVDPNRNVYLPNVFEPGIGLLNDHFGVHTGLGVELVNFMRVYDRWGELMYSRERFLPDNDSSANGWDGKFNGDYVNPGVFVYIVEVKFLDGRVLLYRGDVTVVR